MSSKMRPPPTAGEGELFGSAIKSPSYVVRALHQSLRRARWRGQQPPTPRMAPCRFVPSRVLACSAMLPRHVGRMSEAGRSEPHDGYSRMPYAGESWRRRAESNRRWRFCRRLPAVMGSSAPCAIVLHSPWFSVSVRAGLCWRVLSREEASRRQVGSNGRLDDSLSARSLASTARCGYARQPHGRATPHRRPRPPGVAATGVSSAYPVADACGSRPRPCRGRPRRCSWRGPQAVPVVWPR